MPVYSSSLSTHLCVFLSSLFVNCSLFQRNFREFLLSASILNLLSEHINSCHSRNIWHLFASTKRYRSPSIVNKFSKKSLTPDSNGGQHLKISTFTFYCAHRLVNLGNKSGFYRIQVRIYEIKKNAFFIQMKIS